MFDRTSLAPIVLLAFKRPQHTQRTLDSLAANPEFAVSELHVHCDAARRPDEQAEVDRTRDVVQRFAHPCKHVVEAAVNQGVSRSVVSAVSALCAAHGRVIVLEDDLSVSPAFLDYMNRALHCHANDPSVMQVSGHMFPIDPPAADSVLLPMTTSWGWATWQRAWRSFDPQALSDDGLRRSLRRRYRFDLGGSYPYFAMLQDQRAGRIDSWAIRWHLCVHLAGGRTLFPARTLVHNHGFDGSGTHCVLTATPASVATWPSRPLAVDAPSAEQSAIAFDRVRGYLRRERSLVRRLGDWRRRLFAS